VLEKEIAYFMMVDVSKVDREAEWDALDIL
jgi:hypothetical protein